MMVALAASPWDGNKSQTWSQVLIPEPGFLEAWERAHLVFTLMFRLRETKAMGQGTFDVFFILSPELFTHSFIASRADACIPNNGTFTTSLAY